MSEGVVVRGVLLAHGLMGRGMADAVQRISGLDQEALHPISNDGMSPQALQEELDRLLGDGPAVIFTDLPSGSCALAAQVCCRKRRDRFVVFGVNLPMLLDFVFNRHLPPQELVPRLLERGRKSLRSAPEVPGHADRTLPG
jgi:PTS system mannose-specific IIB component